jgi:hypothetical protein
MSLRSQTFATSGTFNVPLGVTAGWIQGGGPGGGGPVQGGGGFGPYCVSAGAGEFCNMRAIPLTSGGVLNIVIGQPGVPGADATGGVSNTTYGAFNCAPAKAASGSGRAGRGGGIGGGVDGSLTQRMGTRESPTYSGGYAGVETQATPGISPGGAFGPPGTSHTTVAGNGGSADYWPFGGTGGDGSTGSNATAGHTASGYCAGGGGPGSNSTGGPFVLGGTGCAGVVIVYWIAP